jgi:hypothetical protein
MLTIPHLINLRLLILFERTFKFFDIGLQDVWGAKSVSFKMQQELIRFLTNMSCCDRHGWRLACTAAGEDILGWL